MKNLVELLGQMSCKTIKRSKENFSNLSLIWRPKNWCPSRWAQHLLWIHKVLWRCIWEKQPSIHLGTHIHVNASQSATRTIDVKIFFRERRTACQCGGGMTNVVPRSVVAPASTCSAENHISVWFPHILIWLDYVNCIHFDSDFWQVFFDWICHYRASKWYFYSISIKIFTSLPIGQELEEQTLECLSRREARQKAMERGSFDSNTLHRSCFPCIASLPSLTIIFASTFVAERHRFINIWFIVHTLVEPKARNIPIFYL